MTRNKSATTKPRHGKNKGKKYNVAHATRRTLSDEDYKNYFELANQP